VDEQRTKDVSEVARVFFYSPHPDDETLSAGLALVWYLAHGYEVHVVTMNRGGNGGPLGSFNGSNVCNWAEHAYTHNPGREGYSTLTSAALGAARLLECRSAIGAMATVTPTAGFTAGAIYHHEGGLVDAFGTSPTGVNDVKAIISGFAASHPNSFHHTMSYTDDHADHAACGEGLRQLKLVDPSLVNSRFFVSRLYWGPTPPRPADVAAAPGLAWFNAGSRKADFDAVLRNRVVKAYSAWSPAAGSYAIGYHQVAGQFSNNFGPSATIANLWHT
jgi:LmbE family N-acetylglucosaminyl deacetylase